MKTLDAITGAGVCFSVAGGGCAEDYGGQADGQPFPPGNLLPANAGGSPQGTALLPFLAYQPSLAVACCLRLDYRQLSAAS